MNTMPHPFEIRETDTYSHWFKRQTNIPVRAKILARIRRAQVGNLGDVKSVGDGVSEMRIDYGPGYRIYFMYEGRTIIILLVGGVKGTQRKDIETAKRLARELSGKGRLANKKPKKTLKGMG